MDLRFLSLLVVAMAIVSGCDTVPRSKFHEAHQSLPAVRAYALQQLPDLTDREREIIRTQDPTMGQANFVVYYFWWKDSEGKTFVTVEASPPPCKPYVARRSDGR